MTLKPSQIRDILNAKREEFNAFNREAMQVLEQYRQALKQVSEMPDSDLEEKIAKCAKPVGAKPLEPLSKGINAVIAANLAWQNREQSLAWVRDRLTGITTFAVDGSQIYPSKDLSIPIALVQIGWFENLHLPTGGYEKDVAVDIMTPQDLRVGEHGEMADRRVSMRRFQMETQRLVEYMKACSQPESCLVFLDGSLVATFADVFDAETKSFYVDCLLELLRTSEERRVPLVAYIDTTSAKDITGMLQALYDLPEPRSIHDAQLVSRSMEWGDRTPLFLCERSGILDHYEEQRRAITFTYLKTNRDHPPARLEMPLWMHEAGLTEKVLNWVRGEVIVGSGYPYVIETADQTAVLQTEDRQAFYKILQDWAETQGLDLRFSRKMVSKVRRR
ncbi:DNA double-strand break repair nuclease NurA [Oscillatoria sp. FACHB-1407]|uniref:DNA double-strand break repair nuclease NurA n=1 Tax=Oscillatoria sp. FACHB-1407 TaxID=2692847 RepID=UPI001689B39E|nr:DNA double-strand break repair nuclease NurA [Oscillatoria sp. FACHB-1407]MBD2461616.1 DNA double-strand break repair nuclease NurA [Oscillatoria sp. FACHB-1407]